MEERPDSTELRSRSSSVDTWKIDAEITSSRSDLKMAKNKPSLRDLLHEFAEETSAHGAIKISSAKSVFWRIFWVLVSLACLGMVIYQGILLLNTYLDKPTKSDIDVTYIRTVKFPAVTICNLNIIRRSFISRFPEAKAIMSQFNSFIERKDERPGGGGGGPGGPPPNSSGTNNAPDSFGPPDKRKEAMKKSLKIDSSGAEESSSLNNVTVDEQAYAQDLILSMLAKHNESELERGGHKFHELVFRCNWKDFSCKHGDFMKYWKRTWNWRYGNCYTFNSGATGEGKKIPILTSTKPGPNYGLTLDLFVNQEEYIPSLSQEAGVRVLLTAERSITFPVDEGFTVSPGFATSIGLRKLKIIRVDPFNNGSCHKNDDLEEFSVYRHFKGSKYSVQGCMYSCLARAQEKECNCTEGKFRTVSGICSEISDVECIQNLQKQYDNDQLGCSSKCPQPCNQISYRTAMSSSAWSLSYEKQLQAIMLRQGDSKFDDMGKDKDSLRQNFLRINIYFEELNMEKITYSEYYAFENLMSDIGGQLGLWIGVSVITVAEVLKLLLDIFKVLFQKLYFTDVKEIKDINMS
ncbi:degenerin mec-4-like isoform X4 [Orbicella faveolata]|uniref:degenerin mec-4-like isoform X4 n=1 Tax=Orbicella faveolata TaxID=48498 RepID=UPI0009E5EF8B|nr:degenerin mec-4-like isoform X4 [Orbicella faveolata]